MNKNTNEILKMLFLISQIGVTMLVTIFLSMGIGYLLDKYLGTKFMVWFIVLGVGAGFRSTFILIKRFIGQDNGKS